VAYIIYTIKKNEHGKREGDGPSPPELKQICLVLFFVEEKPVVGRNF